MAKVGAERDVMADPAFTSRVANRAWASSLARVEELRGRPALEAAVKKALDIDEAGRPLRPGKLHCQLAELPFAGYLTTNYDNLLEDALRLDPGWVAVGNVGDEVRRVAGDTQRLVWHVHGALHMEETRSRLVLTTEDYDALYADDAPVVRQMKGLLGHRRVVFFGFGLEDPDIMQTLRVIGRLANPAVPILAIVPAVGRFAHSDERRVLLQRFKIDVITYPILGDSHDACLDLIDLYSSLTLRRSLRYGRDLPPPQDYDPETTGLLIYNELVLREHMTVPSDIRASLILAWLLTQLAEGPVEVGKLEEEFRSLVASFAAQLGSAPAKADASAFSDAIDDAIVAKWVRWDGASVALTSEGESAVRDRRARAALQSSKFSNALAARAKLSSLASDAIERVSLVARSYFDDCIERRALGVARAANLHRSPQQEYHAVALLQGLRHFLDRVRDPNEARTLISVVTGVLSEPVSEEIEYIGTSLQARFGVHLLGYDADTLRIRASEFQHTAFLVDSNTLIPLLARSSLAHAEARELTERLRELNVPLITTPLLSKEVMEHAQYAKDAVGSELLELSRPALEAAVGRADSRSNAFLEGLIAEVASGKSTPDLDAYLREVLGINSREPLERLTDHQQEIVAKLAALGVREVKLESLHGFKSPIERTIRAAADRLATRRGTTYKHPRQVRAEAEAQVIVLGLRRGDLGLPAEDGIVNAYFISNTRVIDEEAGEIVTMSRENALHWLATLWPHRPAHAAAIYGGLLWELQERHVDLVPHDTIRRAFRPLLVSSRDQLNEELARHRDLIEQSYGGDGADALLSAAPEVLPTVLSTYQAERNEALSAELRATKAELEVVKAAFEEVQVSMERNKKKERGRSRYERRMKRRRS